MEEVLRQIVMDAINECGLQSMGLPSNNKFITKKGAASILKVSPTTIDRLTREGVLNRYEIPNVQGYRLLLEEVENLPIKRSENTPENKEKSVNMYVKSVRKRKRKALTS